MFKAARCFDNNRISIDVTTMRYFMRRNVGHIFEQGLRDIIRKFDKDKDGVIGF